MWQAARDRVTLEWGVVDNGGSDIIEHELQMDVGMDTLLFATQVLLATAPFKSHCDALKQADHPTLLVFRGIACQHSVTGLAAGHTYRFRARCRNSSGWSVLSSVGVAHTQAVAPQPPSNVRLASPTMQTTVHLAWNVPQSQGGARIHTYKFVLG